MNHHQQLCQNIVSAQCQDLGLEIIELPGDGTVVARLYTRYYQFGWNVTSQCIILHDTIDLDQPLTITEQAA